MSGHTPYKALRHKGLWVLVTASRDWPDEPALRQRLNDIHEYVSEYELGRMTVLHGAARGGDWIAHKWAERAHSGRWNVAAPERRPAKWKAPCRPQCWPDHRKTNKDGATVCPAAGFYRNEEMVAEMVAKKKAGIETLTLAFIYNNSGGASHCYKKALEAGLEPIAVRAYSPDFPDSRKEH